MDGIANRVGVGAAVIVLPRLYAGLRDTALDRGCLRWGSGGSIPGSFRGPFPRNPGGAFKTSNYARSSQPSLECFLVGQQAIAVLLQRFVQAPRVIFAVLLSALSVRPRTRQRCRLPSGALPGLPRW